jgi:hypothetical protein
MSQKIIVGGLFTAIVVVALIGYFVHMVSVSYEYENNISAEWELADKSSTIPAKAEHIDKFVTSLESANLHGEYDAEFYKTNNNSFDTNFSALKTLQSRLHEIAGMNPSSFEYQTAIQQITAQEQGEAHAMLSVIEGSWYHKYHFFLWSWMCGVTVVLGIVILLVIGGCAIKS